MNQDFNANQSDNESFEDTQTGAPSLTPQATNTTTTSRSTTAMSDIATCGIFQYQTGEDLATAGSRWELWLERFKLYILAKDLSADRVKANFLLMIGAEVYEVYKGLRRKEDNETPDEAYKLLSDHFKGQNSPKNKSLGI